MDQKTCISFCHSLAKSFTTGVRLYQKKELIYYYSVYHLHPDPATPYLDAILNNEVTAGVYTTSLSQYYGFLHIDPDTKIILGPTKILQDNKRDLEELLFLLSVEKDQKEVYVQALRSAPMIHADRLAWLLAALATILNGNEFPVDEVWMPLRPNSSQLSIQKEELQELMTVSEDESQSVTQSYAWEQLISSYIEDGKPENLRDLFAAPPSIQAGRMSLDSLRQAKNSGICAAAIASRTAIKSGIDEHEAFRMSDLYIQKLEMLRDVSSIDKLIQDIFIDFAERVKELQFHKETNSKLVAACTQYIAQNIFTAIRADNLAHTLGYTRSYLCSHFKSQVGISLTQYILQEKVLEAKRMLHFTDKSLSEIAVLFAFSSQSHFQTVFKKITGETPLAYRERIQL